MLPVCDILCSPGCHQDTPPPPAPQPHRNEQQALSADLTMPPETVEAAIKDICMALQRTKALPLRSSPAPDTSASDEDCNSPVWIPRYEPLIRNSPPPMQTCSGNSGSRTSPPLLRRHQPPQLPPLQQNVACSRVTSITVAPQPPAPAELERNTLPGPSSDDAADEGIISLKVDVFSKKKKKKSSWASLHTLQDLLYSTIFLI
jgi:hypothetical protein